MFQLWGLTKYAILGFSVWVNLLDYSSVVIPITLVDKNIDVINKDFKPLSDLDEEVQRDCMFSFPSLILSDYEINMIQMTQTCMMVLTLVCRL